MRRAQLCMGGRRHRVAHPTSRMGITNKTAKVLGLTIPPSLLANADTVD